MMTLMRIQISPEAHSFTVKRDNARINRLEIRACRPELLDWKTETYKAGIVD